VPEDHLLELKPFQAAQLDGVLRSFLDGLVHQLIETMQRGIRFPVKNDHIPQVLQRRKNGRRDELHRDQLAGTEDMPEDEP
jgi:hypothetical protein